MRLALGSRDADKVVLRQARRQLEHRSGDGDVVVLGKPAQDVDRRVAYRRETICQLGARLRFDLLDQNPEHVVEQADVLVVVAAGPIEKERGNAPERLHALLA